SKETGHKGADNVISTSAVCVRPTSAGDRILASPGRTWGALGALEYLVCSSRAQLFGEVVPKHLRLLHRPRDLAVDLPAAVGRQHDSAQGQLAAFQHRFRSDRHVASAAKPAQHGTLRLNSPARG